MGETRGAFYNDTACGTLVAVDGTLFGPASIPGGSGAGPRTPFTPVTQSAVTGTGSTDDPFTIVTEVDLGTTGVRLTQTDTYRVGEEIFRTGVSLTKSGTDAVNAIVYRAGDCYLQGSDIGYGMVGSPAGAIGCTAEPAPNPGGRAVQWRPLTEGSHYLQDRYDRLWAAIGAQHPFADTCACTEPLDNSAGLSWSVTVGNSPTVVSSRFPSPGIPSPRCRRRTFR